MLESTLSKKVNKYLKSLENCWFMKIHGSIFQRAGVPDYIGCYKGIFWGIELKVGTNKTSKIQDYMMLLMRSAGGRTIVCYDLIEVKKFMNSLKGESNGYNV